MSLEISDIELMEQIIRICQTRGAFQPTEMTSVGILYNKITTILSQFKKTDIPPHNLPTIKEETKK
jgi:hypothetical protein